MARLSASAVLALFLAASLSGQVLPYGSPTPAPFSAIFDSGGQIPYAGNLNFRLAIRNWPNSYSAGIVLGFAPTSVQISAATLLVDLTSALIVPLPPGISEVSLGVPNVPGIAGYTGYAQAGVFDPQVLGNFGFTNAISVTVLPNRTPTRAYIPGQDFSAGASAPGQMCVLDLSVQPPIFRATGSVGFSGNISNNFPNKIAVSQGAQIAYALGNGTANQFVRAFNIAADPAGVISHTVIGDIPTAGSASSSIGSHDMEAMENGWYLFTMTGGGGSILEVFDVSGMPSVVPTAPVQTINFATGGSGASGLQLSPNGDRLAVVLSSDATTTVTIYAVTPGANPPLTVSSSMTLGAFSGSYTPSDAHFTPDGRLLFVSGPNGVFNVIDTLPSPPVILLGTGTWPSTPGSLWFHGNAVAVQNGAPVAVVGNEGAPGSYHVIDLNTTSSSFGMVTGSFTTNPLTTGSNGNVSNHRMHARQNIVIGIDGSGATADCQFVDVIDLDQPLPAGGYQSWRVKMPTYTNLMPGGISCIPRDFDMF